MRGREVDQAAVVVSYNRMSVTDLPPLYRSGSIRRRRTTPLDGGAGGETYGVASRSDISAFDVELGSLSEFSVKIPHLPPLKRQVFR